MFENLSISSRLKMIGAIMSIMTLMLATVGYVMVSRMAAATHEMYEKGLLGTKLLADANNAVWELRFGIANYTLASPENRVKLRDGRPAFQAVVEESLKKYGELRAGEEKTPVLDELRDAYQKYRDGAPKWFELIDANQMAEAAEYRAKVTNAAGGAMVKSIKALIERQLKMNEELEKSASASAAFARTMLITIGAIAFAIAVVLITLMARAISRPLSRMQAEIEEVERSNDFTRRVTVSGRNEIAHTATAFNKLMATMQSSLRELVQSVDQVSTAAGSLSASSDRVAEGSTQQSEASSAMAATVQQLTVSINSVSDSARMALEVATSSGELSSEGREIIQKTAAEILQIADVLRETSGVIGQLSEQSNRISSVVQVIKEVADQTNLLALNAAIEAARAGEQGRGFAVVADEVRKLAERTTNSTAEITQMIGAIQGSAGEAVSSMHNAVGRMDSGVALAKQAGESINQIKDRAAQVAVVVKDIASALNEQSGASNDMSARVESVARMVEANSAASGDIATETRNLGALSGSMRTVAGRFRI